MSDRLNDSTCVELIIYISVLILSMLSIVTFVTAFIETIDQYMLYFIYPNLVDLGIYTYDILRIIHE